MDAVDFAHVMTLAKRLLQLGYAGERTTEAKADLSDILPKNWWTPEATKLYARINRSLPGPRTRVLDALMKNNRRLDYGALAHMVYPKVLFPKAWRGAIHGGPPGCFMSLSAMLRRMDHVDVHSNGYRRTVCLSNQWNPLTHG